MGDETQYYKRAWYKSAEVWIYSALSAFIGGGASSVAAIVIDPQKFNLNEGLGNIGKMFITAGVINLILYLKQSPLPAMPKDSVTITEQTKTSVVSIPIPEPPTKETK